jgi:hypothetical protein
MNAFLAGFVLSTAIVLTATGIATGIVWLAAAILA